MAIKIITDSTADLPAMLTEELDATVVPVYLRFGDEVYRDRVDIREDDFNGVFGLQSKESLIGGQGKLISCFHGYNFLQSG